jgi:hypothetical protein
MGGRVTSTNFISFVYRSKSWVRSEDFVIIAHGVLIYLSVISLQQPSLAELTAKSEYWAVRNLCRRRIVPLEEFYWRFKGYTAVQWAKYHKKRGLVEELKYFMAEQVCLIST